MYFVDQNCCRTVRYETNHNSTILKYRKNKTKLHNSNYITEYKTYNTVSHRLNKKIINHKSQNTN